MTRRMVTLFGVEFGDTVVAALVDNCDRVCAHRIEKDPK